MSTVFPHSFRENYTFFEFGNPKVKGQKSTVHKGAETIQGKTLFMGGNYMRKYGRSKKGDPPKCLLKKIFESKGFFFI